MSSDVHALVKMPLGYYSGEDFTPIEGTGFAESPYTPEWEGNHAKFIDHILEHLEDQETFIDLAESVIRFYTDKDGILRAELIKLPQNSTQPFAEGQGMVNQVRLSITGTKGMFTHLGHPIQTCVDAISVLEASYSFDEQIAMIALAVESFPVYEGRLKLSTDNLARSIRERKPDRILVQTTKAYIQNVAAGSNYCTYAKEKFRVLYQNMQQVLK